MRALFPLVGLVSIACATPDASPAPVAPGEVRARYADDPVHQGLGGALVTHGIALEPCDAPTIQADPATFVFDGNEGAVEIELPGGPLCGLRIVVLELRIEAEHDGVAKTLIGQDFDFWVPGEHIPTEGGLLVQLGNASWLADILPLAGPGTTRLNSETDPDLLVAFYDGLHQGSTLDAQNTIVEQGE